MPSKTASRPSDSARAATRASAAEDFRFKQSRVGSSGEGAAVRDVKSQLSQLGARAAKSKASNAPLQAAKEVQFTPPNLPGVGGPLGKSRQPHGAQEMAGQALRKAQHKTQPAVRKKVEASTDPAKIKADFEAATRAMTEAIQKKQSTAWALHSNEL
jgi:hypothetical protein